MTGAAGPPTPGRPAVSTVIEDELAPVHRRSPMAWLLVNLIELYRMTASLRTPRCRFHPSCSSYAVVAIERHGARRGGWLAVRRLGRCHPWNPGGIDHVPPRK
jgi:uncharacterized protein